jgi:hypothetical protein
MISNIIEISLYLLNIHWKLLDLKKIAVILFILTTVSVAFSQQKSDSSVYFARPEQRNYFSYTLDKQLNTYTFSPSVNYFANIGKFSFSINEVFNSTYINITPKNIKDEHSLNFKAAYSLDSSWQPGIAIKNNTMKDDRKIGIDRISNLSSSFFIRYSPDQKIYIQPYAGFSKNNQIGQSDAGFLYGLDGEMSKMNISDIEMNSSLKLFNEDISPRKNLLRAFVATLTNNFTPNIRNSLNVNLSRNRKDFYFEADSLTAQKFNISDNIQSRTETAYSMQENFSYKDILRGLSFGFMGRIYKRNITRETRYIASASTSAIYSNKIDEFRLDLEGISAYSTDNFESQFRMFYSERDESNFPVRIDNESDILFKRRQNNEKQKDNISGRSALSYSASWKISSSDKLSLSIMNNKLKYDTPGDENTDDRDELLTTFRITYTRLLNPFLDIFVNLEGSFNHIVYIFSDRSSNNNMQRIIKLGTGASYNGSRFISKNSFEVSANYTVYDFENSGTSNNSFSFRQLAMKDSTVLPLTKSLSLISYNSLKYSEQGSFLWSDFTGKPTHFIREVYFEPKAAFTFQPCILYLGIRYFSLRTYNYVKNVRVIATDYFSIGPLAGFIIQIAKGFQMKADGWHEFIRHENNIRNEMTNFNMSMNWEF